MDIEEAAARKDWQGIVDYVGGQANIALGLRDVLRYAFALEELGRVDDALNVMRTLYEVEPDQQLAERYVSTICRLGYRSPDVDRMIANHPESDFLKAAKSEMAMQDGDLNTGFALAGYRWAASSTPSPRSQLKCASWEGEYYHDGNLLVVPEQGLGEELLFSCAFRYLKPGAIVGCDHRLIDLFRRSYPELVFTPKAALRYNVHDTSRAIEAMDLLRIFHIRENHAGWLSADPAKVAHYKGLMDEAWPNKIHVGLSWASSRAKLGPSKSIPLPDLIPIIGDPINACMNLQYGNAMSSLLALEASGHILYGMDDLNLKDDIDGLAALIMALDVVVTSSNTTAHLAGALGKRTILMAPGGRFVLWYWGREGETTPWYPSIRILRGPPKVPWKELAETANKIIHANC